MGDTGAAWPPHVVGDRYELRGRIGSGGMASVYDGWDSVLDRPVAVKVLHHHLADNTTWRTRFEAEARMAARLTHPNVVQVYDTGSQDGVPFIVMERLPGETLEDHRGERIDGQQVRHWTIELLGALAAAHAIGLVHRDIKPGNVLLTASRSAKLGDFGIAKSIEGEPLTDTGQVIGTVGYLAPERLRGGQGDERSDLYALALVMWEAAAGRKAFDASSPGAVIDQVMHNPPPPLTSVVPGADPALSAVLERGMSADPVGRYQTADATLTDLTAGATGRAPAAPAPADATMVVPAVATGQTSVLRRAEYPAEPVPAPPPPGRGGGSGAWAWLIAVVIVIGLAAGAVIVALARGRDNGGSPSTTTTTAPASTTSSSSATTSTTEAPTTTESSTTTTEAPTTSLTLLPSSTTSTTSSTTSTTSTSTPPTTTSSGLLP